MTSPEGVDPVLEVIDKGSATEAHPVPLLFVHGAWHGAWCWDEHFLDFFADQGFRALAVSLRGHGGSSASKPIRFVSLADYVEDVVTVAESMPTPPVVIGHSSGGSLVQKYLETQQAPAGVLLASTPPRGNTAYNMRWLKRHPWHFMTAAITGKTLHRVNTPKPAREKFFSIHTPEADVVRHAGRLQEDSRRAGLDSPRFTRNSPKHVTTPLLVLGAGCDRMLIPREVHETARAYGTEAEFFPNMGHSMMLEPGWQAVAERIVGWLTGRGL
jgi:pimeloyl-ACP methyl ester carboxylesterase